MAEDKKVADAGNLKLNWDDSKMQTTYANVVNASSTREEVSIFFGTNQTWKAKPKNKWYPGPKSVVPVTIYVKRRKSPPLGGDFFLPTTRVYSIFP